MLSKNITFVVIKNKEVVTSENMTVFTEDEVVRRLQKFQHDEYDTAKAVFGDGNVWDFSFPMNDAEINKKAARFFRNL